MPLAALRTATDLHLRCVLSVRIDDAITVNHVFTMLMVGDVELRGCRDECAAGCKY